MSRVTVGARNPRGVRERGFQLPSNLPVDLLEQTWVSIYLHPVKMRKCALLIMAPQLPSVVYQYRGTVSLFYYWSLMILA